MDCLLKPRFSKQSAGFFILESRGVKMKKIVAFILPLFFLLKLFKRLSIFNTHHQKKITPCFHGLILLIIIAFLNGCAAPRANQALGQLSLGNAKQAWKMVSAELAHPTVSSQEDLCELHLAAIRILGQIVRNDFAPSDPDRIAKESYDYVCKNCSEFKKKQGITESLYGLYFQNTKRPGFAISHIKKAMQINDNPYSNMMNESNIASAYADMGQFEMRDFHRRKAIKIGREYFKTHRTYKYSLDEAGQYMQYKVILEQHLDALSWSEDRSSALPEMLELWDEIKAVNGKWVSKQTQYIAYTSASQRFAAAGDTAFARKILNEGRRLVEKYPYKNPEASKLDLQVAEAKILGAEGKYKEAAAMYEDWINRFEKASGKSLPGNSFRLAGLAQESAKNYDLAIEYLEKAISDFETRRSSFEVESRGEFLSGLVATTYWGLTRSYAARYVQDRNERDFKGALKAERMLRARQFGELLGIDKAGGSDLDISALRLRPDELLLNYVLTDKAIVMFALSSDWHDLFIIPYDARIFNAALKRVRSQLSAPGDTNELINDLQDVGKTILPPIQNRLSKTKKIIVIPDGYLNGIPFAILPKLQNQYYPLVRDYEVASIPSISYMIAQRNSQERPHYDKVLFALADPVYDSRPIPEAHRDDTSEFYTRAVRDLNVFTPLPETRTEVENISRILGTGNTIFLLGINASKANIKSQPLQGYKYLHFATHGVLGNQVPGINEPALILAVQNSAEEGFLTLSEIEKLKLHSDLTVLSACDTGSGKYYTGEGVMGLSRGFIVAGSKSVLASLWPVDSKSTVEFMTLFYQYLQSGKSKSGALRLAQLDLMSGKKRKGSSERGVRIVDQSQQQAELSHPYYWAPFVLTGE